MLRPHLAVLKTRKHLTRISYLQGLHLTLMWSLLLCVVIFQSTVSFTTDEDPHSNKQCTFYFTTPLEHWCFILQSGYRKYKRENMIIWKQRKHPHAKNWHEKQVTQLACILSSVLISNSMDTISRNVVEGKTTNLCASKILKLLESFSLRLSRNKRTFI